MHIACLPAPVPVAAGIAEEEYKRWVDSMVAVKFDYVVAVQTYGRNRTSKDLRLRQLAQGVDTLVARWVPARAGEGKGERAASRVHWLHERIAKLLGHVRTLAYRSAIQ